MSRVALAGFFHETNTFSPYPADLAAFSRPATLPGLTIGEAIPDRFAGLNVPITGAMATLRSLGHALVPIAWASAVPSGPVTREAFETLAGRIVDGIAAAGALDGIYLDLHGAMVSEPYEDAEYELLRRIRARVGTDLPIVASFDLHANLSPARVGVLDALAVFRSYPHLDMAETGARAASLLHRCMAGERFTMAFRQIPYLVPLHAQSTLSGPAARLYAACGARTDVVTAELALGFPPADIFDCGPSLAVIGVDVTAAADELEHLVLAAEPDFAMQLPDADEAVRRALRSERRPVVIADTQDNPGAGGTGDTVGLLRALIEHDAPDTVLALLHDPDAAREAHRIGTGASARFRLGAHSGAVPEQPVEEVFAVEALSDGHIVATGPMYRGNTWEIGAAALLRHRGVRVLVAERRLQAADASVLRHIGLEPRALGIIVLKSTVHFRADYEAIAGEIIVAAAPGLHLADNRAFAYRRLRPGVRLMPGAA
jgi:microcystin degradation protein MlrC